MSIIEKMLYEARPFIYGLIGFYALLNYGNKTLVTCGLVLISCSALVVYMRVTYRERLERAKINPTQTNKTHLTL